MLQVGGWGLIRYCSDGVEPVHIVLSAGDPVLVSHYIPSRALRALLVVLTRAACSVLQGVRALGRSPTGHEVDCSSQICAIRQMKFE
jgi:hypothetical protein